MQLLEMQKAFTEHCEYPTLNNLPTCDEITELQANYNNMHNILTAIIDLPDDIAYLYRLAQKNPLLYAELACKPNGLQE